MNGILLKKDEIFSHLNVREYLNLLNYLSFKAKLSTTHIAIKIVVNINNQSIFNHKHKIISIKTIIPKIFDIILFFNLLNSLCKYYNITKTDFYICFIVREYY